MTTNTNGGAVERESQISIKLARQPRVGKPKGFRDPGAHPTGFGYTDEWGVSRKLCEKLYGPHNPDRITDKALRLMGSDWTLGMALQIWKAAYLSAHYWIDGPSKELNAFVASIWERYKATYLAALLTGLQWGRVSAELVWALEDVRFVVDEGERTRRSQFVLRDLRAFDPQRVRLFWEPLTGDFKGFELRYSQGTTMFTEQTALHATVNAEFGSLVGQSILKNAYTPWWRTNWTYLQLHQYLERKGDPPYVGRAPSEEVEDSAGVLHDPIATTALGALNLRGGGNFILPAEVDAESKQFLYELREVRVAERAQEFLPSLQHGEALKAIGAFTSPSMILPGKAFASSRVSKRVQGDISAALHTSVILVPMNAVIIPRTVLANFGENVSAADMPKLKGGRLSDNATEVLAEIVRANLNAATITAKGKIVPLGSRIDAKRALEAIGVPQVDEARLPKDIEVQKPPPPGAPGGPPGVNPNRPEPGQPRAIATNPTRPEGPQERGLARGAPERIELAATPADNARMWFRRANAFLTEIDGIVSAADAAIERIHASAQEQVRRIMKRAIRGAEKRRTQDGRTVLSTRNRRLANQVRAEVFDLLLDRFDTRALDANEIATSAFARTPLARGHIAAGKAARRFLGDTGVPAPSKAQASRAAKDVVRDGKTNGRGQATREARRVQEIIDRMIQGGTDVDTALAQASDHVVGTRDLKLSTVSHVRATARATLSHAAVLDSPDIGGWAVMVSRNERRNLWQNFPRGKIATELAFTTFDSAKALDERFSAIVATGRPHTSWRNLGRNFFSSEMYLPFTVAMAAAVKDLMSAERMKFNERRAREQQRLDQELSTQLARSVPQNLQACVSRKVPKLIAEGMDNDQAVAVAVSMCKKSSA